MPIESPNFAGYAWQSVQTRFESATWILWLTRRVGRVPARLVGLGRTRHMPQARRQRAGLISYCECLKQIKPGAILSGRPEAGIVMELAQDRPVALITGASSGIGEIFA